MTKALAAAAAALAAFPLSLILLVTASTGARPGRARRHRPGRDADRAGHVRDPRGLPGLVHGRREDLPRPALVGAGLHRRGRNRPRPLHPARRPLRFQQRRRRRPDAVRARHLRSVRGQRRPRPAAQPLRPGRRDLHRRRDAVRERRRGGTPAGLQNAIFAYNHASCTSARSWHGPRSTPPRPAATPQPPRSRSRWPSSASPTSGARPGQAPMTAPAWSTPPTPPPASTSPAPPTSGSKTAPSSRCPRSSPATCCSARAGRHRVHPGHVVMYLGNGQVIQANQPARRSRPAPSTWPASSWPPVPQTWQASHDQH